MTICVDCQTPARRGLRCSPCSRKHTRRERYAALKADPAAYGAFKDVQRALMAKRRADEKAARQEEAS